MAKAHRRWRARRGPRRCRGVRRRRGDLSRLLILAMPRREGNIYRVAGEIRRSSADGSEARHTFVRVDTDGDYDTVVQLSLRKGRLLVDENGDALFD
ncbi:MAG: HlyU family transcriptional regulator [Arhodomonas sp.]|nr:HlyU family transcriptional regulator [Arhodomonas sp.]